MFTTIENPLGKAIVCFDCFPLCFRFLALGTNLFNYSALLQALGKVLSCLHQSKALLHTVLSSQGVSTRGCLRDASIWYQRISHEGLRHLHPPHQCGQREDLPGALACLRHGLLAQPGPTGAPGTLGVASTATLYSPSPIAFFFDFSSGGLTRQLCI